MSELFSTLAIGVVVFASTNLDDLPLLAAFFAEGGLSFRAVVQGQFLGMIVLLVVSAGAAAASLAAPEGWTALLGVVPLVLGVGGLAGLRRADGVPAPRRRAGSPMLAVTAITLASGADNLAVYVPLFAREPRIVPLYAALFLILTAIWCALVHALVNHRLLRDRLRRYGRVALPLVLIGVGLYVLSGALVLLR